LYKDSVPEHFSGSYAQDRKCLKIEMSHITDSEISQLSPLTNCTSVDSCVTTPREEKTLVACTDDNTNVLCIPQFTKNQIDNIIKFENLTEKLLGGLLWSIIMKNTKKFMIF